jgi:glycosyltransferase involved in cell wall biosynthesis
MAMKKICIAFNHFQYSDGVARSAVAIANYLVTSADVDVVLRPIFRFDKSMLESVNPAVRVKPLLGFYFSGLGRILDHLPGKMLHRWILGGQQFDVEIGFQYGISTKAAAFAKQSIGSPIVWMHGYDEGLVLRKYYHKAKRVICVSRGNAERLKQELSDPSVTVDYCYNPIDEKKVISDGSAEIDIQPAKKPLFVSVGRNTPEKGYKRLLSVCAKLRDEGFRFEMWLIGNGPEHEALVSLANQLELNEVVHFLGEQKNPHQYTAKADLFVCSSFSEGYSTACTEALILGVPVLTTRVGGAEEIIDDANCGMIVETDDESLYRGLKEILQQPTLIDGWKGTLSETKRFFYAENRVKKLFSILDL